MQVHDRRFRASWIILLPLAAASSGCLAVAAGVAGGAAAGYAYWQGRVGESYNANFNDAWAASRQALVELGMPLSKEDHQGSDGFIESRTSDGDTVRIYVEAEPSKLPAEGQVTHVSVRVSTFGDHPLSNRILDQVNLHLAPVTAVAAPAAGPVMQASASTAAPPLAAAQQTEPPPTLPSQPIPAGK